MNLSVRVPCEEESMTDSKGRTPIFKASENNDLVRVQQMYTEGCKFNLPDINGITPVYMAAVYGHSEMVEFLLSIGAEVDVAGGFYEFTPSMLLHIRDTWKQSESCWLMEPTWTKRII